MPPMVLLVRGIREGNALIVGEVRSIIDALARLLDPGELRSDLGGPLIRALKERRQLRGTWVRTGSANGCRQLGEDAEYSWLKCYCN